MALDTNSFSTYEAIGNREDLQSVIYDISPTETPVTTAIGVGKASAVYTEWQTDSLAGASTTNAALEGDIVTVAASTPTTRVGNTCQIFVKSVSITGTQEAVDKAGRGSELDYQKAKRGQELLRDIEATILTNQGMNAGATTTARKLRSLNSWLNSNTSRGTSGVSTSGVAGSDSTTATAAAVDAAGTREFTETLLQTVLQSVYNNGGNPTMLSVGPYNKTVVSDFTGRASARQNIAIDRIQASASLYASDFADLKVIPNRFQRERDAWVLDLDYLSLAYLRRIKYENLAKTADSKRGFMVAELTLCVKNEAAHGLVADLTTQSSSV